MRKFVKSILVGLLSTICCLTVLACSQGITQNHTEHEWGEWEVFDPPTCRREGIEIRRCKIGNCNEREERPIERLEHEWALEREENYDCQQPVNRIYCCVNCGEEKIEKGPATGHDYVLITETPATCEMNGNKSYECKNCHNRYDETLPATGHDYKLKKSIPATCQKGSYGIYECEKCKAIDERLINPEFDYSNHNYIEESFDATCERAGGTYYRCADCGYDRYEYDDENKPALKHDYSVEHISATCRSYGRNYSTCKRCGHTESENIDSEPPVPHNYEWQTITEPTCSSYGTKRGECSYCHKVQSADIEKLNHTYNRYGECDKCRSSYYYFYKNGDFACISGIDEEVAKTLEVAEIPKTCVIDSNTYRVKQISSNAFENNAKIKKVILPEGLEIISSYAFYGMTALEEVNIPSTVSQFADGAFDNCKNLATAYFNTNHFADGETGPYYGFFDGCEKLKRIIFGENVTALPRNFYQGTAVENVELPDSITVINDSAASGVTTLKSIKANNVTTIGRNAFYDCASLTTAELPKVTSIADYAFNGCASLTIAELPKVTSIADYAFNGCAQLNIALPSGLLRIGSGAFKGCASITSVVLPKSLNYIGSGAFGGCGTIDEFSALYAIENVLDVFSSSDVIKNAYVCASNAALFSTGTKINKLTITSGAVNDQTFALHYSTSSYKIETLELGEGVNFAGGLNNIRLNKIILPKSITVIPENAFMGTGITELECKGEITKICNNAFLYTNIRDWYVPSSLKTVEGDLGFITHNSSFYLESVHISDFTAWLNVDFKGSLPPIRSGINVYVNGAEITEITIPESVTKITNILNWPNLVKLTLHKNVELSKACLYGFKNLEELTVPTATGFRELFSGSGYVENSSLKKVVVLSGDIPSDCFNGFNSLEQLVLPDDCTAINHTFGGVLKSTLTKLTTISKQDEDFALPQSLKTIAKDVFRYVTLSKVTVTDLGRFANIDFKNIYSNPAYTAKEIEMPTTLTVGKNDRVSPFALVKIKRLDSIVVDSENAYVKYDKNGLVTGYNKERYFLRFNKDSAESPDLSGIHYIVPYAFSGYALKSVNLNVSSLIEIYESAFTGCSNLTGISLPFINKKTGLSYREDYLIHRMFGKEYFAGSTKISCDVGQYSSVTMADFYVPSTLKSVSICGGAVGYNAFKDIKSLKSISFISVTSIASSALSGVSSLKSIYFNYDTMSDFDVSNSPFGRNNKSLGSDVEVTFGPDVTYIPRYMFYENSSITRVNLKSSKCEKIGFAAFKDCPIYQLYLPTENYVTIEKYDNTLNGTLPNENIIEIASFKDENQPDLDYLKQYSVNNYRKPEPFWTFESIIKTTEDGFVYAQTKEGAEKELSLLISYVGDAEEVVVPESLNNREYTLRQRAFAGTKVNKVIFPGTFTSIPAGTFSGSTIETVEFGPSIVRIEEDAFNNCADLKNVNYTGTIADWCNIEFGYEWRNHGNPISRAENFIVGGERISDLVIPEGVEKINDFAFDGYRLNSLTLPATLKKIGGSAFTYFEKLNYTGNIGSWCNIEFNYNPLTTIKVLYINGNLVTDLIVEGTEKISAKAFKGALFDGVTIKSSVKYIESSAFENVTAKTLTIENGITSIGAQAFKSATFENTKKLVLPSTLTTISYEAFNGVLLDEVTFNEGLISIGSDAFTRTNLTQAIFPSTLTEIDSRAFSGLNLTNVEFGNSLKTIGSYAFYNTKISNLVLPDGIEKIEWDAFASITTLTNVTINGTGTFFSSDVFFGDDAITTLIFNGTASEWAGNEFYNETANPLYFAKKLYLGGALAKNIVIENVTAVGSYAFVNAELESVELKGIESVKCGAFKNATLLTEIIVPEGAQKVEDNAFENILTLTAAALPDSLTSMGRNVFAGCVNLKELTIPFFGTPANDKTIASIADTSSLQTITVTKDCAIPDDAFRNIATLTTVNLPETVTRIGSFAFDGCNNLKNLELSAALTYIDYYALPRDSKLESLNYHGTPEDLCALNTKERLFSKTKKFLFNGEELTDITISENVKSINFAAFAYSTFNSVFINVEEAGSYAFEYSTIQSLTFGNNVKRIGKSFAEYASVANISFGNGLQSIGDLAFYGNKTLKRAVIPDTVTEVSSGAFGDCPELNYIDLPCVNYNIRPYNFLSLKGGGTLQVDNGLEINVRGGTVLEGFNFTHVQKVTVADSVTTIAKLAFNNCVYLKEIELSNNVSVIGDEAFRDCSALKQIAIPDNADLVVYDQNKKNFGRNVFENAGLTQVTLPESMTYIPVGLFKNCDLTSISFPSALYRIEFDAFEGNNFTEIVVPESITWLESGAFYKCLELTKFKIPGTVQNLYYSNHEYKSGFFLTSVFNGKDGYIIPEGLTAIDIYGPKITSYFFGAGDCPQVDINLSEGLTEIDEYAFSGAKMVKKVTLPSTLETIKINAFEQSSITEITIPRSIESIPTRAFKDCLNLKTVNFENGDLHAPTYPDTVSLLTTIGEYAFENSGVQTIKFPSKLTTICEGAFKGSALTEIAYNGNCTLRTIDKSAFENCAELVEMNQSFGFVSIISENAFSGCEKLKTISTSGIVETISAGAFKNTKALLSVNFDNVKKIGEQAFAGSGLIRFSIAQFIEVKENYAKFKPYASESATEAVTVLTFTDHYTYYPSYQFADYLTGRNNGSGYTYSDYVYKLDEQSA